MVKSLLMVVAIGMALGFMLPGGPPSPPPAPTVAPSGSGEIVLERSEGGHFYVDAEVNGTLVHFLVDTGASGVTLTVEDARRAGLEFSEDSFTVVARGASGDARGKLLTLDRVSVRGKDAANVDGMVLEGLEISLLGQSYLSRISGVQMSGDYMTLR